MHIDRDRIRKLYREELSETEVQAESEAKAEDSLRDLVTFQKHDVPEQTEGKPSLTEEVRLVSEELPENEFTKEVFPETNDSEDLPDNENEEDFTEDTTESLKTDQVELRPEEDEPESEETGEEEVDSEEPFEEDDFDEDELPEKRRLSGKWILLIIVLVLALLAAAFKIYMDQSYKPQDSYKKMDTSELDIEITDNMIVVRNSNLSNEPEKAGLIFYSDLRVEPECYLPLMVKLANKGYDCFLPVAFGNQPYLNTEGAISVIRKYVSIKNWFLIGHSRSCTTAASFAAKEPGKLRGLIYLGGYSEKDLSSYKLPLLSIRGTKDGIVNPLKFEDAKENDPKGTEYQVIKDGNNSGFVDTTLLDGDKESGLSFQEQTDQTVDLIDRFSYQAIQKSQK